jgi:2-methylisocitrate lyase-like PEP mutase family enzyme
MLDGGKTPILGNRELYEMGFEMVVLGTTLIMRVARLLRDTLADMRQDRLSWTGTSVTFDEYKEMVGFPDWTEVEKRFS